jgi:hypothetical protein
MYRTGPALSAAGCPLASANNYSPVPILGSPRGSDPVPALDPDLNLTVRSHVATTASLTLVDIDGDTDPDAPQLDKLVRPPRLPTFAAAYQVYDWDAVCTAAGCRGTVLTQPEVTLLALATAPREIIYPPGRQADIFAGLYVALVLHAEETRLTLSFTRDDSPAVGYVLHLEELCVDPSLLQLYQTLDQAGRASLPGVRFADPLGIARASSIVVAIRDTGSFMDPRSRKDWWKGY